MYRRNAAVATHDYHVRDAVDVVLPADDAFLVADQCQVNAAQGTLYLPKAVAALAPIYGEYHQLVARRRLLQTGQHAHFLSAWRAPGGPEGNDDDLSAVVGELRRPSEPGR